MRSACAVSERRTAQLSVLLSSERTGQIADKVLTAKRVSRVKRKRRLKDDRLRVANIRPLRAGILVYCLVNRFRK
jgi:hypothetical protein